MSDNVQSAMFEILKSVQASIGELRSDVGVLQQGQAELKEIARKQRRDMAGILGLRKGAAGEIDERVDALERRVAVLESGSRTR